MICRTLFFEFIGLSLVFAAPALPAGQEPDEVSPAALLMEGKVEAALIMVRRSPRDGIETLETVMQAVDQLASEEKFDQAESNLALARQFIEKFQAIAPTSQLSLSRVQARQSRIQALRHMENKDPSKAKSVFEKALLEATDPKDKSLRGRIRNNLGQTYLSLAKFEGAVQEFAKARDTAESQNDNLSAGIYNFNLGLAQFQLRSLEQALISFRKSLSQNESASKKVQARKIYWIGRTHMALEQFDRAAQEFAKARDTAESSSNDVSAGEYNFYLGRAQYRLNRWKESNDSFHKSRSQSQLAARKTLEARSVYWLGLVSSHLNPTGKEAIGHLQEAEKMFAAIGDRLYLGLCYRYQAEHTAYALDFAAAAELAQKAIEPFTEVGDTRRLKECYNFLADMYARVEQKQKSDDYKKKAAAIPE